MSLGLQGHSSEVYGHDWDVQTVFVANDWPTAILPLHLLAVQNLETPALESFESFPLVHEVEGSDQVAIHSRPPVHACQNLAKLQNATPADIAWHEALAALHHAMQEALQTAKVQFQVAGHAWRQFDFPF